MQFVLFLVSLALLVSFGVDIVMYTQYQNYINHNCRETLMRIITLTEKQFPVLYDPDRLVREAEAQSDEFFETSSDLFKIADSFNMPYIYYLQIVNNQIRIIASSGWTRDYLEDLLVFHKPSDFSPDVMTVYETKQTRMAKNPHTSQFGTAISTFCPIVKNGEVIGILGADYDVSFVKALRRQAQFAFVLSMGLAVIIAGMLAFYIASTIVAPIKEVENAAEALANMNFDVVTIKKFRKDEIGKMQQALMKIRDNLCKNLNELNINMNQLKEANRKASTDALTHLYNREAFYNNVNLILRMDRVQGQLYAFMILDIDNFKHINDTYGHATGDEVLKACAEALNRIFRSSDKIARIGGDEFTVFCKNVGSREAVEQKAGKIKEAFTGIRPDKAANPVTASVGIALVVDESVDYAVLFEKADAALYQVKKHGRNGFAIYG
jgi:diguanylate cyclase (GGDEF)-like protein